MRSVLQYGLHNMIQSRCSKNNGDVDTCWFLPWLSTLGIPSTSFFLSPRLTGVGILLFLPFPTTSQWGEAVLAIVSAVKLNRLVEYYVLQLPVNVKLKTEDDTYIFSGINSASVIHVYDIKKKPFITFEIHVQHNKSCNMSKKSKLIL